MASVLVVDDDPDIRAALQLLLNTAGFDVCTAGNGREAARVLAANHPQLIVLDLMMPEMDGWDFLDETKPLAPVIVVSGAGELMQKRPLHGNVVKMLSKPFEIGAFMAAVREYGPPSSRSHS